MNRCYLCLKVSARLAFQEMIQTTAPNLKRKVKRPLCPDCRKCYEEIYQD